MKSLKPALVFQIALTILTIGLVSRPVAQITMDSTHIGPGVRPYDQPIDPELYLIRPGERLEVVFLYAKLAALELVVNAEGRIVHRDLGVIDLSGKTLSQARKILGEPLALLYNADEIVISVTSIYPVSIRVSGLVNRPGTYVGYTSQRAAEIIDSAGGIAPGGSTRRIMFSGGPESVTVDLDRWRYLGESRSNPGLYVGSHLHVPYRGDAGIQVIGEVITPRSIEFVTGETLADLLALAGGPFPGADTSAVYLLNDSVRSVGNIQPGDIIVVPESSVIGAEKSVLIFGAVGRPGRQILTGQMSLSELIKKAGNYSTKANQARVTVFRPVEEDALGRRVTGRYPLGLNRRDQAGDLILKPGDSVYVPLLVGYVTVSGLVAHPGILPYVSGATAKDYIRMTGGYADEVDNVVIQIYDRVSRLSRVASPNSVVYDGDRVDVRPGSKKE